MIKEVYEQLSTFDKIEFDIEMKMYMKYNDKIASIYDNLGDVYSYKDLEEAKSLEEHETLQEYKKVLKEKCEQLEQKDKKIELLNNKIKDIRKELEIICEINDIDIIKAQLINMKYRIKGEW